LAKNLRHKTLEFSELGMSMDLPKVRVLGVLTRVLGVLTRVLWVLT
jgi:hypothetical protein